jgi:hypothetical protein
MCYRAASRPGIGEYGGDGLWPRETEYRPLPVVFAVWDFLALFEHVFFGLVVGNVFWR